MHICDTPPCKNRPASPSPTPKSCSTSIRAASRFRRWGWAVSRSVTALHVLFLTLLVLPAVLPLFAAPAQAAWMQLFNLQLLAVLVAGAMVRLAVREFAGRGSRLISDLGL